MMRKKTLLIIFFLSLFIFQQVQASTELLPNKEKAPQVDSIRASGTLAQLYITVAHLDNQNKPIKDSNGIIDKCSYEGDPRWGCGEAGYPYKINPLWIDVESNYLPNVLAREMDVATLSHTLASLQAQALAARSYATVRVPKDNSVNFQVYIPNAYELYDPSSTEDIGQAVTSTQGQYLSQGGSVIDAQFASDSVDRTATCINADGTQCHPYLIKVSDPISAQGLSNTACDSGNYGNSTTQGVDWNKVWGMSQKGALRWSLGNQCVPKGVSTNSWPVTWNDYRQILVHYYTGIDILNASGNKIAPDNRWNLLNHSLLPTVPGNLPEMNSGTSSLINLTIQNTSTWDWAANDVILGYQWTPIGADGTPVPANPTGWNPIFWLPVVTKGDLPITITPSIPAYPYGGDHALHLDLMKSQSGEWFSNQVPFWPDATIKVHVIGPAVATFTPTATVIGTPVVISSPTIIPTLTPTPVPFKSLEFFDWNSNIWTGTGGYQPCTTYPYISCSAVVTSTQTNPDRVDFDIIYNYNDYRPDFGADFYVDLRLKTNIFNTNVPLYWYISGDPMPTRWITTQYSGTADYGSRDNPIPNLARSWTMPGQPSPYDKFTFHFLRTTSAPEILNQTSSWHFTIATYDTGCYWGKNGHLLAK